jgi:HlyD family secretion protein
MSRTKKLVVGGVVLGILALTAAIGVARSQERAVEVRVEEVRERDLVSTITATGSVRARREVSISSDVMGRVVALTVEEGDEVERDQVLLRIDPTQFEAAVARARATLSQANAQVAQQQANLLQAQRQLDRNRQLRDEDPGLISVQALQESETQVEVQRALLESARHGVEQAQASLEEAEDQLRRTTIRAPISGRVTRLDIEEGETVVVGTMNNPGSLLLTISDLSAVEAVLRVDEVDVPRLSLGDSAKVELDAFPGNGYSARVSKIGNSAIRSQTGAAAAQGTTVDYEVILNLLDPPAELRPDLSATADVVVASRPGAVAVPIISVTVREVPVGEVESNGVDWDGGEEREGVFVVRDGRAHFTPVGLGITGREYFEVLSGVAAGDTVVSGPFQQIQNLEDGDRVRVAGPPPRSR